MEKHFGAAGADIIRHAMKAFFFHSPSSAVIKLYVTLICENVFLFSTQFYWVKYNAMKLMPFIIIGYHSVMPHAIRFSAVIYFEIHGWKNKFLIEPPFCASFKCFNVCCPPLLYSLVQLQPSSHPPSTASSSLVTNKSTINFQFVCLKIKINKLKAGKSEVFLIIHFRLQTFRLFSYR